MVSIRSQKVMLCQRLLRHNTAGVFILVCGLLICPIRSVLGQVNIGPLYCLWYGDISHTTNLEAVGPMLFLATSEETLQWAFRPIISYDYNRKAESIELDVLYPIFTYDRRGAEYKLQLLQLLSASGGATSSGRNFERFTVFPLFFSQRSHRATENYTALFPVAGRLKNRFFRDEIEFVLWPLYVKTVRTQRGQTTQLTPGATPFSMHTQATEGKVVTRNFIAPVFHVRNGPGLKGWQFWPLIGRERKFVTAYTNVWDEIEVVPGHESRFVFWPIYLQQTRNVGTTNVEQYTAFLPLYAQLRSSNRDSTSYLWPVGVTVTHDRSRRYREVGAPWPLIVFASGEGKTTRRVFPFFSQARSATAASEWYLWPLYKRSRLNTQPLERDRTRVLFFLFSDTVERNTQAGVSRRQTALWPLFSATRSYDGVERFQLFSMLEPILPNNTSIERNYSPLWAIWRSEKNPVAGVTNQSLLWNLYRRDASAENQKWSVLFGLFHFESAATEKRLRLFYIPITKKPKPAMRFQQLCPDHQTNTVCGGTNAPDR